MIVKEVAYSCRPLPRTRTGKVEEETCETTETRVQRKAAQAAAIPHWKSVLAEGGARRGVLWFAGFANPVGWGRRDLS